MWDSGRGCVTRLLKSGHAAFGLATAAFLLRAAGQTVPDFRLRDQNGRKQSLRSILDIPISIRVMETVTLAGAQQLEPLLDERQRRQ